jgi:hypothetical protein
VDRCRKYRYGLDRAVGEHQLGPAAASVQPGRPAAGGAGGGLAAWGALFHLLPEAVTLLGNHLAVYGWVAGGMFVFFLLEQYLYWHHCHRPARTVRWDI